MQRSVILCEGFNDRDFWGGWLDYLGASNLFLDSGEDWSRLEARVAPDPVHRGDHVFENAAGDRIYVRPCKSLRAVWKSLGDLIEKDLDPPAGIIVNVDSDRLAGEGDPETGARDRLKQVIRESTDRNSTGNPPHQLDRSRVDLVVWHCGDAAGTLGVPDKQTLERLVCAAIAEASASAEVPQGWAGSVRDFLNQEPRGGQGHKNHALVYCAKWFVPEREDLFRAVWSRDSFPKVAAALQSRLSATGAWKVAEALVDPAKNPGEDSL